MLPTRPKGIVIEAPSVAMHLAKEEEDEPISRGLDLTPLAIDIPLAGLSKEEQLSFAVKASIDTIQENRPTRWQALFMTVLQVLDLLSLILFFFMLRITYLNIITLMFVFT